MKDLKAKEILENIFDAFDEASCESIEAAKETLIDAGFDPDEELDKGMQLIKKLQGKARLLVAEQEAKKIMIKAKEKIEEFKRVFTGEPKEKLSQLIAESGSFAFRKIESIDENDALEMLSEAEALKFLESIDKLLINKDNNGK